jgi:DNA-binding CsgD family transcriptional regulator
MIALAAHRRPISPSAIEPGPCALVTALGGQLAALALDYLETAVLVLDANARIYFASAAARRLLETGRLCVRNGLLSSPVDSETTRLRRIVRQYTETASAGSIQMTFHRLGEVDDGLRLGLVAVRVGGFASDRPFVIVFAAQRCDDQLPDTGQLRSQFGLTHAQAKLAIEIAKGEGLRACTRRLGIAMSTGRSHLKQIFQKTETRRQAELVRLIAACRFGASGPEDADQLS